MPVTLRDPGAASPSKTAIIIDRGDVVGQPKTVYIVTGMSDGVVTFMQVPESSAGVKSGPLPTSELEFWREREAFRLIRPEELARFEGEYVASRGGRIVDHDPDLATLTGRFFAEHGDVPVYIEKIGEEAEIRLDTPFFD